MLEATCRTCGETFCPADESDTVHLSREDGTECGGPGEIVGEWGNHLPDPSGPVAAVIRRISHDILPVSGAMAFLDDPGGWLAYFGETEDDAVCAAAIDYVTRSYRDAWAALDAGHRRMK